MGLYGPAAQGIMSHRVDPGEQGQLQGALSSMMGICGMIAPTIFTRTFAAFIDPNGLHAPGAPLILSGLLTALALVIALRVTRGVPASHRDWLQQSFYPLTLPLTVGPGSLSVAVTLGANASGRLPVTFPLDSGQQPYHYARAPSGRTAPTDRPLAKFTRHYIDLPDAYLSVTEAIRAGGFHHDCRVNIRWVSSDDCATPEGAARNLSDLDGICVPGGFGVRGIEGVSALREDRAPPTMLRGQLCLGGRIVVMSYQSLEDRIVKQALAEGARSQAPVDLPVVPDGMQPWLRWLPQKPP